MESPAKESGDLDSNEHLHSDDDLKHTLISLLSKKKAGHSDLELSLRSLLSKEKTKINQNDDDLSHANKLLANRRKIMYCRS